MLSIVEGTVLACGILVFMTVTALMHIRDHMICYDKSDLGSESGRLIRDASDVSL